MPDETFAIQTDFRTNENFLGNKKDPQLNGFEQKQKTTHPLILWKKITKCIIYCTLGISDQKAKNYLSVFNA
jgi:hypothetical protein